MERQTIDWRIEHWEEDVSKNRWKVFEPGKEWQRCSTRIPGALPLSNTYIEELVREVTEDLREG